MTWILWSVAGLFAFVKIAERVVLVQKKRREIAERLARRQLRRSCLSESSLEMACDDEDGNENAAARRPRRFAYRNDLGVGHLDRTSKISGVQREGQS